MRYKVVFRLAEAVLVRFVAARGYADAVAQIQAEFEGRAIIRAVDRVSA